MQLDVSKSLETISDIENLALDGIDFYRDKSALILKLGKLIKLGQDVSKLVNDAPQALPELKDLEPGEIGQLTEAAYKAVKTVYNAIIAVGVEE